MRRLAFLVVAFCLAVGCFFSPVSKAEGVMSGGGGDKVAVGKDGMVATAHPLASKIGAEVLKKGGNAIDAPIAIQYALNVTEPMMSGIGGLRLHDGLRRRDEGNVDHQQQGACSGGSQT